MTVLEVLVAAGIAGAFSLIISALFTNLYTVHRNNLQSKDLIEEMDEIRSLLQSRATCQSSLQNLDPTSGLVAVPSIRDKNNNPVYVPGNSYDSNRIRIDAIDIVDWEADGGAAPLLYAGNAKVRVTFTKNSPTLGAARVERFTAIRIQLKGFTGDAPANEIKLCAGYGPKQNAIAIWDQNPDNTIYYNVGNVGLWSEDPSQKLSLAETTGNPDNGIVLATAYEYISDRRLKKDVRPVAGLPMIRKLRGVRYEWEKGSRAEIGLIAQEAERVAPELVENPGGSGTRSVKLANFVALLVEASKTLDAENRELEKRIDLLERRIQQRKGSGP